MGEQFMRTIKVQSIPGFLDNEPEPINYLATKDDEVCN